MNRLINNPNFNSQLLHSYRAVIAVWTLAAVLLGFLAVLAFPATSEAAVIRRAPNNLGLVGYWSFDDARGSTATDFSGNGNAGTLTNMDPGSDWVAGKRGTALDFDGSDDYVNIPDAQPLKADNTITVSLWIKGNPNDAGDGYARAISKSDQSEGWALQRNSNNDYFGLRIDTTATSSKTIRDTGTVLDNTWHHVAFTIDSGTAKLYRDGVVQENGSYDHRNGFGDNTEPLQLAADTSEGTKRLKAEIDEVRIYDRALSSSEIKDLYNAGGYAKRNATADALYPDKLVSHWSMDGSDVNGPTVKDVFGANDGTENGNLVARPGRLGQALEFEKAEREYFQVPHDSAFNPKNLSLSLWMYRVGDQDRWAEAFIKGRYFGSSSCDDWSWGLEQNGNSGSGKWKWDVCHEGGENAITTDVIPNKEWTHIVGTYASSTSELRLYQNGELIGSKIRSGDRITNTGDIYIGCYGDGACSGFSGGGAFNGRIDDVRVYDAALSADEVSQLYSATKPDTINSSQNNKLTDGLVGMWSFDGQDLSGSTAEDVSGNGSGGTLQNGPQPAIGRIGQALKFDGGDDWIDVGSSVATLESNVVSVSAWVKTKESGTTQVAFGNYINNGDDGYSLGVKNGNGRFFALNSSESFSSASTTGSVTDGDWHHLLGVFDGGDQEMRIYLDGELSGSKKVSYSSIEYEPDSPVVMGKRPTRDESYFNGKIDNVRIYDRALNESEIERMYSLGR
jgi:hypothetical protein